MNIKITYNWLLEYLDTDATPHEIQKYLSLCGPSVEKVEKKESDYIFDIEITTNRVDAASVFGIARECKAILPQFGKKALLKYNPLQKRENNQYKSDAHEHTLVISNDQKLCSRFTAIVLKDIVLKPSPQFIQERLNMVGIKTINNVVDISNYLMVAFGQPTHIFDYDTIKGRTMIVRESIKGESITTLDGKTCVLDEGDMVIEDGGGRLIDLCGIMGALRSAVTEKTKNIVLFVQTYNKEKIRKTSMRLGQRTMTATYFEKGLDEELIEPTITYGLQLLHTYTSASVSSPMYDLYPHPFTPRTITIAQNDIERLIGIPIKKEKIFSILDSLGFTIKPNTSYSVSIPSFRKNDVRIKEDIVEELSRIYGYFNLPSEIPLTKLPPVDKNMERIILYENRVKNILNTWGLHEMYNYSMISEKQISALDLDNTDHLKIKNTISSDIEYMRTSLVPSLLKNIHDNERFIDSYAFFELAKVYRKKSNQLPDEIEILTIATNTDYFDLKGIVESLFESLNINNVLFKPQSSIAFLSKTIQAEISNLGWIGKLGQSYQVKHGIKKSVYLAELNFEKLIERARPFISYLPINPYAVIMLDLTLPQKPHTYVQSIIDNIKKTKPLDASIHFKAEVIGTYQNKLTLRFYFSSPTRNITLDEAKKELKEISYYLTK